MPLILVVDDEQGVRGVVRRTLERDGHEVLEAGDVQVARVALSTLDIDLIVCDISMPGEDGLTLLREIRHHNPATAVLMLSGVSDTEVGEQAVASGASGYVVKPFTAQELRLNVSLALRRRADEQIASVELIAAQERLQATEQTLRALAGQSPFGILYSDLSGKCIYANDAAAGIAGRDSDDLLDTGWLGTTHPDEFPQIIAAFAAMRESGTPCSFEHHVVRPDGTQRPVLTRIAPVVNDDGSVTAYQALIEDLTERHQVHAELTRRITHDDVTGLPNEDLFLEFVSRACREDGHRAYAVLAIGLHRMSLLQDTYGTALNDQLLAEMAGRVRGRCEPAHMLGRLGGYIMVLAKFRETRTIVQLAEELLGLVGDPFAPPFDGVLLAANVGISMTGPNEDPEKVALGACFAAREAEKQGAGTHAFASERKRQDVANRLELETALRSAIQKGAIDVHYQPELRADGSLYGVEALVRWTHDGTAVPASVLVQVAEECGLIFELGRHVLATACWQAANWRNVHRHLSDLVVSVNASALELGNRDYAATVADILRTTGLSAEALCIELTESVVAQGPTTVAFQVRSLRRLGVRVALDDFGTGYSSFAQLLDVPVDLLKIDRRFISRIEKTGDARKVVGGIIKLAHSLGSVVVAEGVESEAEIELLVDLGCDLLQGFAFSTPMSAIELDLRQWDVPAIV